MFFGLHCGKMYTVFHTVSHPYVLRYPCPNIYIIFINWSEFGKVNEDYETLLFDVNWDENINTDMDCIETSTSEETLLFDVNLFVYLISLLL